MRRKARFKAVALAAVAVALIYFAIAYLLLPTFWMEHERHLTDNIDSFLTTTPQGIPGDPINVGLVGTKEEVLGAFAKAGWHPADRDHLAQFHRHRPQRGVRPARCRRAGQHADLRGPAPGSRLRESRRRERRQAPSRPILAERRRQTTTVRSGSARRASTAASASATTPARSRTISAPISTPSATIVIRDLLTKAGADRVYQRGRGARSNQGRPQWRRRPLFHRRQGADRRPGARLPRLRNNEIAEIRAEPFSTRPRGC